MSIKFSVLLPTRNRLELAKGAIHTVLRQRYDKWEVIVADNCSAEPVGDYIATLNDDRFIYFRSEVPLPVTENWNRALDASSGDYVIMLGDDDGLTPSYFFRMARAIQSLQEPEFLYTGAYHFAFPGVLSWAREGALTDVTLYQSMLRDCAGKSLLDTEDARALGKAALDMRAHYAFNMQHFLFSRRFINTMKRYGPFFQGPFPDFYAANMAMLTADKIGIIPEPLVVIGISPKSYGYYHFNNQEKDGADFLNTSRFEDRTPAPVRERMLPGSNMNSSWLASVALIPELLGGGLHVNVSRYRKLQILQNIKQIASGQNPRVSLKALSPLLTFSEQLFAAGLAALLLPTRIAKGNVQNLIFSWVDRITGQYLAPPANAPRPLFGKHKTMEEVFSALRVEPTKSQGAA